MMLACVDTTTTQATPRKLTSRSFPLKFYASGWAPALTKKQDNYSNTATLEKKQSTKMRGEYRLEMKSYALPKEWKSAPRA